MVSISVNTWLTEAQKQLEIAGVSTARLDCLVLLEDETGKDRAWLLAHPEFELQGSILKVLSTKITQRAEHMPLAYIRGKVEFYGREFTVDSHTLVPRPETETMIDMLKRVRNREADTGVWEVVRRGRQQTKKHYAFEKDEPPSNLIKTDGGYKVVWSKPPRSNLTQPPAPIHGQGLMYHDENLCLIDIGTGSGAIAITAKLEMPDATVLAIDIDKNCLKTAKMNAQNLTASVEFLSGNLLEPFLQGPSLQNVHLNDFRPVTILLCNLPYVPNGFTVNSAARHEPKLALFGGADGLDLYRELFKQIRDGHIKPSYVITESLPSQHGLLAAIATDYGYALTRTDDFIQLFEAAQ